MDIRKIVHKILLEQADENQQPQLTRAQKELFQRLSTKWKETIPQLTDNDAFEIFLEYRKVIPQIKDENQQAVKSFLYRGQGKYTINDLRDGNKVNIKDLMMFLLEFSNFRKKLDGGEENVNAEKQRLDAIFNESSQGRGKDAITPDKITESKKMWEGNKNLIINEGDFRVYAVNTREEAKRFGYYYQEKLKELVIHNIEENVGPIRDMYKPKNEYNHPTERYSVSPWCVFSRGDDQRVMYNDEMIINKVNNMYTSYRDDYYFFLAIDESKNLLGPGGEYHISTMAKRYGGFKIASMYNGEYNLSPQDLLRIYPKLNGHLDKLTYKEYNFQYETNDNTPPSILETINEIEGSPNAFWMQGPDEKRAYIDAGGQLKNPKSWETMTNDLRTQYIDSIQLHDARQKIGSEEFMRAIIKSGTSWRNKLDRRMKIIGTSGIGYLADDFMKNNYKPDFFGVKNTNVRIYKNTQTKLHGIYDVSDCEWVTKDGITYEPEFKLTPLDEDIIDKETGKFYLVNMFTHGNRKFYSLSDMDDDEFNVYIISERKFNELKEKLDQQNVSDIESDSDIGEGYI